MENLDERYVLIATDKPFNLATIQAMGDILSEGGLETRLLQGKYSRDQLIEALQGTDHLIVRSDTVDRLVLDSSNGLKQIVRAGTGTEKIDGAYAGVRGIWVENTPGQNANAVAELTLGYILSYARNLHLAYHQAQQGSPLPKEMMGYELAELNIGIQGFGRIGRLVADKLHKLGAKATVFDIDAPTNEDSRIYGVTVASSPEEVYVGAHVVSMHMPPEGNIHLVNRNLISRMMEKGFLINTSRPEEVNHADIVAVMQDRPHFFYAIDCAQDDFPQELTPEYRPRVLWTNKWGAQTRPANDNTGIAAAKQVVYFHITGKPMYPVNNPVHN